MRKLPWFSLLAVSVALPAHAAITYGPILGRGRTPDTVIVRWGTSASAPTALDVRLAGGASAMTLAGADGTDHEVVITGLTTASLYEYTARSGADEASSSFTTCPAPGEALTFAAYGDNRSDPETHGRLVDRIAADPPDLVINSGDIVPDGTRSQYLTEFFPVAGSLYRDVPFVPSVGNHDLHTAFEAGFASVMPIPADAGGVKRTWYAVTCGNVVFIALDANEPEDAGQLAFLSETLAAAAADANIQHVIPVFHHSPYSSGADHGDQLDVRQAWAPSFEAAGSKVTVAFSGHDHIYERILANGVTYVVSGGGGATLDGQGAGTSGATSQKFVNAHHYVRVTVRGATLEASVVDVDGAVIDTWTLTSSVPDPPPDPGTDPPPDPGDPGPGGTGDGTGEPGGDGPGDPAPPSGGANEPGGTLVGGCGVAPRGAGAGWLLMIGAFAFLYRRR